MDTGPLADLRALLADHEARLAAQEARDAALRARRAARQLRTPPRRRSRRWLANTALALLVALVPLGLFAASPFTDLTGGVHDENIGAIYDAGVTKGCVPDQEYCPTANVTREEMASFLARLGGLGSNPPVANAKTLQGKETDAFLASTGDSDYQYSFYGVVAEDPGDVEFTYLAGPEVRVSPKVAGQMDVRLPLEAPTRLFNRALAVRGVAVCYEKNGAMKIASTAVSTGRIGEGTALLQEVAEHASENPECYILSDATPEVPDGPLYLRLTFSLPQNAINSDIRLYSVRLILIPVPPGP